MPRRPGTKKQQELLQFPRASRRRATKRDVAREYGVSLRTVDTWMHEKKIPFYKISPRVVRFDLDAVARALDRFVVREVS
jgi:excisionase family DNA binding protein